MLEFGNPDNLNLFKNTFQVFFIPNNNFHIGARKINNNDTRKFYKLLFQ